MNSRFERDHWSVFIRLPPRSSFTDIFKLIFRFTFVVLLEVFRSPLGLDADRVKEPDEVEVPIGLCRRAHS